jgi:C4-dicarboxylate transporter DctQ subunit
MSVDDTADRSSGSGLLEKVDKAYFELEKVFNYASALVILGLMFLAVFQVIGRKVINLPVRGYVDWVEFAMPLFAFMGIAYCQAVGGHVRMEFIISRFKGRLLWFLEMLSTLVAMLIISLLMWYGYEHFLRAWNIGDSSIDIEIVIWPGKLLVVVAFASLLLRLVLQLFGYIRLLIYPDARPIAVPLIETIDEQAQHEIDTGLAGEEEKVVIVGQKAEAD